MTIFRWLRKMLFIGIVNKILLYLSDISSSCKKILDIGCGSSGFFNQREDLVVYGLDINYETVKKSINKKVVLGNAGQLPFLDNSFDGAIAVLLLHSISLVDQKAVLTEMKRVIKGGGKLIVLDFCLSEGIVGKIISCLLLIEEMCCGQKHYQNYIEFMKSGGLDGLLRLTGFGYKVIAKYRFGNLVLVEVL